MHQLFNNNNNNCTMSVLVFGVQYCEYVNDETMSTIISFSNSIIRMDSIELYVLCACLQNGFVIYAQRALCIRALRYYSAIQADSIFVCLDFFDFIKCFHWKYLLPK